MYNLSNDKIYELRSYIVEIMRDPNYVLDDNIRGFTDIYKNKKKEDLMEVIAYLYEIINQLYFHEEYHYMFHWANKAGSWVEENNIDDIINDRLSMRGKTND